MDFPELPLPPFPEIPEPEDEEFEYDLDDDEEEVVGSESDSDEGAPIRSRKRRKQTTENVAEIVQEWWTTHATKRFKAGVKYEKDEVYSSYVAWCAPARSPRRSNVFWRSLKKLEVVDYPHHKTKKPGEPKYLYMVTFKAQGESSSSDHAREGP